MKNKKIIITILILLVLAISITSVSASDNTETNTTETLSQVNSVDTNKIEKNNEQSAYESEKINNSYYEITNIDNFTDEISITNNKTTYKEKEILRRTNQDLLSRTVEISSLSVIEATTTLIKVKIVLSDKLSMTDSINIELRDSNNNILSNHIAYPTDKEFDMSFPGQYAGTYTVIAKLRSTSKEISLTITKPTPSISVTAKTVNYNTGTYSISGTCNVNGLSINLKQGSTSLGSTTVSNGAWTVSGISSTKFNPGQYTLTASSAETSNYNAASGTAKLTVSKSTPTVTVTNKNIDYNSGTYTLGGTVKVGSNNVGTGTVTIYKNDVEIGTASVTSSGSWTSSSISSTLYDVDTYTIKASYASNTYYDANSGTGTLIISKVTPTITVSTSPDIKYGNGVYTVSGTAKYGSNNVDMGTVTLKQGSTVLGTGSVSGGLWTVSNIDTTLVDPSSSAYTITAYYENNVNYNAASATNYLTVSKFTPDISIESTNIWYNQSGGGVLKGKVYTYNGDFYSGFIDLYVNGELVAYNVVVSSSGNWSYTLSSTTNLSPGTYSVRVDWKGNEYTNSNSFTDNRYIVNQGMVIPIITSTGNIDIGRSEYVYVDVNNIMGGGYLSGMTVKLSGSGIAGVLEMISDSNGRATFMVPDLDAGKYDDWKVSVVSNTYYYPTMSSFNVAVFYVQYPLTVNITGVSPNNSTYPDEIIVTGFTNADQNPEGNVSLTIGGKVYTGFFDSSGNFTASLIGVKPGIYNNITVKYNPTVDEFYYRGVESIVSIPETGVTLC